MSHSRHPVRKRLRKMVQGRDKGICFYCNQPAIRPTSDHVRPKRCGGRSTIWNVVTACYACNMAKGSRFDQQLIDAVIVKTCRYLASIPYPLEGSNGQKAH